MKTISLAFFLLVLPFLMPSHAQNVELEQGNLEDLIRDYILENPEILIESLNNYEREQQQALQRQQQEILQNSESVLTRSEHQFVLGNPQGDVTLVEFFDYNCGFCRRAMADVDRLLEADKNLKIVLKEFPVLGEGSVEAARVSIAASKVSPDKYLDLHRQMLSTEGQLDERTALLLVGRVGIDEKALQTYLAENDVNETINEVYSIASSLGLTGTPTFIIGQEILPGAVGYDVLIEKIEAMRQCGETTCS